VAAENTVRVASFVVASVLQGPRFVTSVVISLLHSLPLSHSLPRIATPGDRRAPTPARRAEPNAAAASSLDLGRPEAVCVAVAAMARLALARRSISCSLASSRLSPVLGVEEPTSHRLSVDSV